MLRPRQVGNGQPSVELPTQIDANAVVPITRGNAEGAGGSVIGNDLSITGQNIIIRTEGSLRIDGTLEADIEASDVVVSPHGRVQGTISAERVVTQGSVGGTIRAREVIVEATATIDGDIHYQTMAMNAGAAFNGRSQQLKDGAATKPASA